MKGGQAVDWSHVVLPDIFCPFPADFAPHPAAEEVGRQVLAHLHEIQAAPDVHATAAGVRLVDFTGRLYPGSSARGLHLAMMLTLIVFSHEDWVDSGAINHHPQSATWASKTYEHAMAVFDATAAPTAEDPPFLRLLKPFGLAVRAFDRADITHRVRSRLQQWMHAQLWEQDLLRRGRVPALTVYRDLRQHTSGCLLIYDLFPLVFELPIKADLLDHPVVRALTGRMANYCAWVNDLLSLPKEIEEQSTTNLVLILARDHGLSPQQAIEAGAAAVRDEAIAYQDLRQHLPALGLLPNRALAPYLHRLEEYQANSLTYQQQAPRWTRDKPADPTPPGQDGHREPN
jgi:hypothetical protein